MEFGTPQSWFLLGKYFRRKGFKFTDRVVDGSASLGGMNFMTRSFASMALGLCLILAGCNTAKVTNQSNLGTAPSSRPTVIYVSDFDLDAGEIQSTGIATLLPFRPLSTGL